MSFFLRTSSVRKRTRWCSFPRVCSSRCWFAPISLTVGRTCLLTSARVCDQQFCISSTATETSIIFWILKNAFVPSFSVSGIVGIFSCCKEKYHEAYGVTTRCFSQCSMLVWLGSGMVPLPARQLAAFCLCLCRVENRTWRTIPLSLLFVFKMYFIYLKSRWK